MMRIPFSYIWRSLWARRLTTALTVGGVALVVFVFAGVLMLARGLEAALIETGSPDNVIVLRRSATSELSSQIDRATADVLEVESGVARGAEGRALLSREGVLVIDLYKKKSNALGNVSIRGVSPHALELRPGVHIVQGRPFQFGTHEVVVGKSIASEFKGAALGSELAMLFPTTTSWVPNWNGRPWTMWTPGRSSSARGDTPRIDTLPSALLFFL